MNTLTHAFLKDLEHFAYALESLDHIWHILFPDKNSKWRHIRTTKYDNTFYIYCIDEDNGVLEVPPHGPATISDTGSFSASLQPVSEETWCSLIRDAHAWLRIARKNWIKAAKRVAREYPLTHRKGIIPHAVVREKLIHAFRLDRELGVSKSRAMINLVESGFFWRAENTEVSSMTANRFFEYCRIAYIAASDRSNPVNPSLSGRDMYKLYADGRHSGLLDIDPDSESAFAEWLAGKRPGSSPSGGHPWEIKRGGNTTHIDLYVSRPASVVSKRFTITLRGESFTRMAETISMFLAIHAAGLPISIANPESVRKRILGQDNLGLVPEYDSLHRANQYFPADQHVHDVTHLNSLGRHKKHLLPLITWHPLPILRPLTQPPPDLH